MIYDLSQYLVSYLIRHSLNVKNYDLKAQCDGHTNDSCTVRKSSSPWATIHEQMNFNKLCLLLNMTSSTAKIPFEYTTKQFTDADFCIRETIFQVPAWIEGSNSFTVTKWKLKT